MDCSAVLACQPCAPSPTQVAAQSTGWPSNSLLVGRNGHHARLDRECFTSAHPCRLWWRLPISRIERAWSGGSWPAASHAAGHKSESGGWLLAALVL